MREHRVTPVSPGVRAVGRGAGRLSAWGGVGPGPSRGAASPPGRRGLVAVGRDLIEIWVGLNRAWPDGCGMHAW